MAMGAEAGRPSVATRPIPAKAVSMIDRSGQHIGDGFNPAVGVPGKAGPIVLRPLVAEIVQQELMRSHRVSSCLGLSKNSVFRWMGL